MKTLYLVRHAKSSWKYPQLEDFERPLNKRGRKNAPFMGDILKKQGVLPDFIVSSPANRAALTARIVADRIGYPLEEIFYDESMYGIGAGGMLELVKAIDDSVKVLMLVGHNPEMTSLANTLGNESISNLPTSGIYGIQLEISSWEMISAQAGKTILFEFPKKYRSP